MSNIISVLLAVDFMLLVISFFTLMVKLLPTVWLDEIAKATASILLAGTVIKMFS